MLANVVGYLFCEQCWASAGAWGEKSNGSFIVGVLLHTPISDTITRCFKFALNLCLERKAWKLYCTCVCTTRYGKLRDLRSKIREGGREGERFAIAIVVKRSLKTHSYSYN